MSVNFTPRTQEVLSLAKKLALKFSHTEVNSEHVLLSLIKVDSFLLPYIEQKVGVSFYDLEKILASSLSSFERSQHNTSSISFSREVRSFLDLAHNLSSARQHSYVSVEHLLYAMLNDLDCTALDYFIACDIDVVKVQESLEDVLSQDIPSSEELLYSDEPPVEPTKPKVKSSNSQTLDAYGVNLNTLAKNGEYDFIFPNLTYLNQMEETLCRKTKSCVLLVGDAGVGKTALVEGLAKKIVNLESNDYLVNKTLISMDLSSMVAGAKYRGQFEERIKAFIDEAKQDKSIILFIDEIHTIVGAGNSEGALDAANILKPYISRGEITCIGSTTHEEYKKSFGKDAALKRRFYTIQVAEPSLDESTEIITNLIPAYASFHNVGYEIDSIIEAVNLSDKFIYNKQLPDKAIDLLDQAGAALKIKKYKKPKIAKQMEKALTSEDVNPATKNKIYEDYKSVMDKWGKRKIKNLPVVTPKEIRLVLSTNLNIPIESLNETHSNKLINLSNRMNKDVVGQDEAISKIVNALFKTHCGLKDPNRPIGSFLFLGKTGVGKTLTSKSLAKHYFGCEKKLIYFDMSEFSESSSVSKFSGSSPGYVGYEEGGILTEKIKRNPHSVLLFDEIEKAHPIVLQSLLQILEEGRMTDNSGEETSFKNTIIILTSNLGADLIDKNGSVGFLSKNTSKKDKVLEEAKKKLSPELVNRFDGIVLFNNFKDQDLKRIINIELNKVKKKLKNKNIKINFSPLVKKYILEKTISENLGGRPIRRIIQTEIEVTIAKFIIFNECKNLKLTIKNERLDCYAITQKA